jgi:hypothetical protein
MALFRLHRDYSMVSSCANWSICARRSRQVVKAEASFSSLCAIRSVFAELVFILLGSQCPTVKLKPHHVCPKEHEIASS